MSLTDHPDGLIRAEFLASPGEVAPGDEESQRLQEMIKSARDWRIDISDRRKSFVFLSGEGYTSPAPVSVESEQGAALAPAFEALRRAIVDERAHLLEAVGSEAALPESYVAHASGIRCRVQRLSPSGHHVRITSGLRSLARGGMPAAMRTKLLGKELSAGGLVIVCGSYGTGKTSTMNAIIKERVEAHGGYALVIGSPIEYLFAGFHGEAGNPGYVEQLDLVLTGQDLASAVKASMRNFPAGAVSILGYPELLGPEGVGEMLRAANRGSLVFADMHAVNVEGAILSVVANGVQDGEAYSRELLANALQAIVYLKANTVGKGRLAVTYEILSIEAAGRAALRDSSMPLARAINSILTMPAAPSAGRPENQARR